MAAIFSNLASGTITDAPLLIGGTTVNSAAFALLPVVATPNFMWMTLDPTGVAGTPEIVKVTAHTSAATACTIVRGQQTSQGGGAARQHLVSTKWACGVTASDLDDLPHRLLTAKGGLISASGAATPSVLAVGTDGQELLADSSQATGLRWATVPAPYSPPVTTKGDLFTFDTAGQRLAAGTNQKYLRPNSGTATGLEWVWNGIPVFASTGARDAAITAPTAGMVAYIVGYGETAYDGTAWTAPWNLPWGLAYTISSFNGGVDQTGIDALSAVVTGTSVAYAHSAHRYVRLDASLLTEKTTSGGGVGVYFFVDGVKVGDVAYRYVQGYVGSGGDDLFHAIGFVHYITDGASHTYTIVVAASAGEVTIKNSAFTGTFSITDVGPGGQAPV